MVYENGVLSLSKDDYITMLQEQRLLLERLTSTKITAYHENIESSISSQSLISTFFTSYDEKGRATPYLRWDMRIRVTPYIHNHSSYQATNEPVCTALLQPLTNRGLTFREGVRLRTLPGVEISEKYSSTVVIENVTLPKHKGWVEFVPTMVNSYGYMHGKWTDVYIPRSSHGLLNGVYEVLQTPIH